MSQRSPSSAEELVLKEVELRGADFSGRRVKRFVAVSSRFVDCDFRAMRIDGGCFGAGPKYSEYVGCVFDGAVLSRVDPGRASFVNCSFRDVRIREINSFDAEYVGCTFTGLIRDGFFNGRPLRYPGMPPNPKEVLEFTDNDFSGAVLRNIDFRSGIDLSRQSLPTGEDYILVLNAGPVLRRAFELVEAWPATDPVRTKVRAGLRVALYDLAGGQNDFFWSLVSWKNSAEAKALRTLISQAQAEVTGLSS